jgi:capsule biosynthesis phosphatase
MSLHKRIVLDFDDTLAFTSNRDWENAEPNIDLIEKCNELYNAGWQIDIFTARGSISCRSRVEAEEKYGEQIRTWLEKHHVKYHMLSFDKPLAAYYIDDKGITPEDFICADIRELQGGLSGSDIYTDGVLVHKTASNAHEVAKWYKETGSAVRTPEIHRVVGDTLTMDYIEHDEDFFKHSPYKALAMIQEALDEFGEIPVTKKFLTFDDYIARIVGHVQLAKLDMFNDVVERLANIELDYGYCHGDFGIKNMLFNQYDMYLIDPIPNVFGCRELDIAKFIASLIINKYSPAEQDLAINTLLAYNHWIDKSDLLTLTAAEIVRVYKYHPDKDFIIQCVDDLLAMIDYGK